jgi:S1-C subfamily serine protease
VIANRVFPLLILSICITPKAIAITHVEACKQFSAAVIPIQTARGKGTGFIVSSDGWIMTASHVVIDPKTHAPDTAIIVRLPDGTTPLAILKTPANAFFISHDIAILKVDRTGLPQLGLGDENESDIGSSAAIIGFPFSAGVSTKFCLTATVAAIETVRLQSGNVNAVYFQGPSVKGVSGSPVISLDSGKVIGIVTIKLTGISLDLQREGEQISNSAREGLLLTG